MKKDLVIVNHFSQPESGNDRFCFLANLLCEKNYEVEIVTSTFAHVKKQQRTIDDSLKTKYKFTFLHEPNYTKNVELKRLKCHNIFGKNLKQYLEKRKKPDLIYCAVPSIDAAYSASEYCKNNNIPFIIDVQDIWPEAFKMAFRVPIVSDVLFFPMKKKVDKIYSSADSIIAVSQTYKQRALSVNKKNTRNLSVFLGTNKNSFDKFAIENRVQKPEDEVWVAYVGTLGTSYNIKGTIDALSVLKKKNINNIKFVVMGDGPLKAGFEEYAAKKGVYCEFAGRMDYPKMVGLLCSCDIAINPLINSATQSIINKVGDYAMAGLPVVNTLNKKEYIELLNNYNAGISCSNDINKMADSIEKLYNDRNLRQTLGQNNRKIGEELFDREITYPKIIEEVEVLLKVRNGI